MKSSFFDINLPFGGQIHTSLCFRSERGDYCARLLDTWEALFTDFNLLGPVFMIMPAPHAVLARVAKQAEFISSFSELIDTRNDLSLDLSKIASGLLVEETGAPEQKRVGFQFFNHAGQGILKVLLTNQSNLEWFGTMVDYYVIDPSSAESVDPAMDSLPEPAMKETSLKDLELLWPFFLHNPSSQNLPGTSLSRFETAQRLGQNFSREVPSRLLGSILRLAKRYALPLHLHLVGYSGSFQHSMVLQRLENCGECWHAIGADGDMHFYPKPNQHYRISCYQEGDRLHHCLDCFDDQGTFLGSLTCQPTGDANHFTLWNHWLGHLSE